MRYVIESRNGDTVLYFFKNCRRVQSPAFSEDIEDAYVFDTKERAYRMMALISAQAPEIDMWVAGVEDEKPKLRGADGYVPLEKTVKAMLSSDFRKRLWAEYEQLNTRRHKAKEALKVASNPLRKMILRSQIANMQNYMLDLLARCDQECIDLNVVEAEIESDD